MNNNKVIFTIALVLTITFLSCAINNSEKKRYDILINVDKYHSFYANLITNIDTYISKYQRPPKSYQVFIDELESIYSNIETEIILTKYFNEQNMRFKKDSLNRNLTIYFIGPDGLDDSLRNIISWTNKLKFNEYLKLKGDIAIVNINLERFQNIEDK